MLSNRKGFTLIELLIVVVIIGILAAIAIPKFANTKERAYIAQMKSDLKNLATAQEAYFSTGLTYGDAAQLTPFFQPTAGVTGFTVTPVAGGWSAVIGNVNTDITCDIFVGAANTSTTAPDGQPECR
jgi:type IV pilus assembly protein PilA